MNASQRTANRDLGKRLAVVVAAMFGFGYLLVPFYEKICEVTGIRNLGSADLVTSTQIDAARSVRLELDANTRNLPWQFKPQENTVDVHPGELRQVVYEVVNTTDRVLIGQAIPSYAPSEAAQYFKKLDCFCFRTQTLLPGERREMPVVLVIDTNLPAHIATVTLSYTFFEVEGGAKLASRFATTE
ncbi:MAG TPA: cytochrome c oxidase assembly protein [Casimicrobiaceae bacterium]|nr:cytochrome c oxidase assembly protein [Casimicrobiaceae bacterium]